MNEPQQFVDRRPNKFFFRHIVRKIFFEDWALKLAALAITFALWLGVTGLSTPTTQRMSGVPLTLRYSNNTEITNSPIAEVDIVISGDKRKVSQVNKSDLVLSVDITDVLPGDRRISLTPENVSLSLPTGVKLEEIQPNLIAIRLEAVDEREIAVEPRFTGSLPNGFEIYSAAVQPGKVRVRGPASYVRSLANIPTEPVDLEGRMTDYTARQVPVVVSNPKATALEAVVDVTFRIGPKRVERAFTVPVENDAFRRASVVLLGPETLFEGINADDLRVEMIRNDAGVEVPRLVLPPELDGKVEIAKLKVNS